MNLFRKFLGRRFDSGHIHQEFLCKIAEVAVNGLNANQRVTGYVSF